MQVLQAQATDIADTQAEAARQQQDGVVPLPFGGGAIDSREQGLHVSAAPDGREPSIPCHSDLGDMDAEIVREDPLHAQEAQKGTEVGHDHSHRLGPEMDLGAQKVRDVCRLDRGRLTRLVRFQEVEESGEVARPAAHGARSAAEVIPAEDPIRVQQGLERNREVHRPCGAAAELITAVQVELDQDPHDGPDQALSRS